MEEFTSLNPIKSVDPVSVHVITPAAVIVQLLDMATELNPLPSAINIRPVLAVSEFTDAMSAAVMVSSRIMVLVTLPVPIAVVPVESIVMSPVTVVELNCDPSDTRILPVACVVELINVSSLVPMVSAAMSVTPALVIVTSPVTVVELNCDPSDTRILPVP